MKTEGGGSSKNESFVYSKRLKLSYFQAKGHFHLKKVFSLKLAWKYLKELHRAVEWDNGLPVQDQCAHVFSGFDTPKMIGFDALFSIISISKVHINYFASLKKRLLTSMFK